MAAILSTRASKISQANPAAGLVDLTTGVVGVLPIANGGTNSNNGIQPIAAKAVDGPIASAIGTIVITKGSALGASTLATPTPTTHDGYVIRIIAATAFAHVVSCAAGKINGGAITTLTFTSASVGDSVTLIAYQGVWLTIGTTGTITLT